MFVTPVRSSSLLVTISLSKASSSSILQEMYQFPQAGGPFPSTTATFYRSVCYEHVRPWQKVIFNPNTTCTSPMPRNCTAPFLFPLHQRASNERFEKIHLSTPSVVSFCTVTRMTQSEITMLCSTACDCDVCRERRSLCLTDLHPGLTERFEVYS